MKFGAHEVIELADMLKEKVNLIQHFSWYEQEAQDESLKSMIKRQLDAIIQGYDQWVATIHDASAKHRIAPPMIQPESSVDRIKYGLRQQSQPIQPQTSGKFNDAAIAQALLYWHKIAASHHITRGLEMTDPQLRQLFVNATIMCFNQAYETFLYLNQRGLYVIPTFEPQTMQAELGVFQPVQQNASASFGTGASKSQPVSYGTGTPTATTHQSPVYR